MSEKQERLTAAADTLENLLDAPQTEMQFEAAKTLLENAWTFEQNENTIWAGPVHIVPDERTGNRVLVFDRETGDELGQLSGGEIRDLVAGETVAGDDDDD